MSITFVGMSTEQSIIEFIEVEAARRGITPSTFCNYAVNDGSLHRRLMEGATLTLRTIRRLREYAEKNQPEARS
jgi:hypothetical protein